MLLPLIVPGSPTPGTPTRVTRSSIGRGMGDEAGRRPGWANTEGLWKYGPALD